VACLNSIGLLVLGLDYAILLGIFGGALNVIPYVGGVISALLPMLVALATKPIIYVFYILIQFIVVQFLDNNLIMPRIVASKVQVNGLVSVFVVVLGGMMWGVTGMFLSIPFSAILKVTLDHYKGYEAWGRLLGNEKLISES
jgi:predicted PurR-regulated permease PerM